MLSGFPVYVDLPASDIARASRWYEDVLGLVPVMRFGPGLLYSSGGVPFLIYQTKAAGTAKNTAASWIVDDIGAVMASLRAAGVTFEDYAMGDQGPTTVDGVAPGPDGAKAAWFKDSEGNVLSINQLPPGISIPGLLLR